MKTYDAEELARENGENGARTLVAVNGDVFDVSSSKRWIKGKHMKRHQAGLDLSSELQSAPHGTEVLERFEKVGTFRKAPAVQYTGIRQKVEVALEQQPFFRRHPHPAAVHFPLALPLVAAVFEVLALVSGSEMLEWAAFCCLIVGALILPVAVATGYFTWWVNYEATSSPTILKKRRLAWVALLLGFLAVIVRAFMVTEPLRVGNVDTLLYVINLVALAGVVSWVGFLGGMLTFPYDHH